MNREVTMINSIKQIDEYKRYRTKKTIIIILLLFMVAIASVLAINAGALGLNLYQVFCAILGRGDETSKLIVWNIRMPRVLAAIIGGAGLSTAGCVMQNNLRNPGFTIDAGNIKFGGFWSQFSNYCFWGRKSGSTSLDAVAINNPYVVTTSAFIWAMVSAMVILMLARFRGFTPEAMVLSGVAISSVFSAGTMLIQYFAQDVQVAAAVFWTFGDLGRAVGNEVIIMTVVIGLSIIYFLFRRWDYNAIDSGEENAKSLGVHVENIRLGGMFVSSLITAVVVSFLGIIGFIGLVPPQIMRRIIGGDHRYLIPASALAGALLLLVSDTLARTVISPVVLPVGAITSFFGAPLFLYLLARGYRNK